MLPLPSIDYTPLTKKWVSTLRVRRELKIKDAWLPDSHYPGNHPAFSLGEEETKRAARLHAFAARNNFGFIGNLPGILPFPRSSFHSLATLNYATMITHGIIIPLKPGWLEIGELRVDNATLENPHDSRFTYAKVTLAQQLPDLTLDSLGAGLPTNRRGKSIYQTESNEFNRHFRLYLDTSHAHAGLKVLSPDVMATLIDHFRQFDIEMRDHSISLITYGHEITNPATLKNFIETISILTRELSYQIRNPVETTFLPADIEAYKKANNYLEKHETIPQKFSRYMLVICAAAIAISIAASLVAAYLRS